MVESTVLQETSDYYVYEYFIKDSNEVFYVGKGKGRRAWSDSRNADCERVKQENDWDVRIVADGLTELAALEAERCLVQEYLDEGHPITNRSPGNAAPTKLNHRQVSEARYLLYLVKSNILRMSYVDISKETGVYQAKLSAISKEIELLDGESPWSLGMEVPENMSEIICSYGTEKLTSDEIKAGNVKYLIDLIDKKVLKMTQKEISSSLCVTEQFVSGVKLGELYTDVQRIKPCNLGDLLREHSGNKLSEQERLVGMIKYVIKISRLGVLNINKSEIAKNFDTTLAIVVDIDRRKTGSDCLEVKPDSSMLATLLQEYGV